jgi:hypothetical protein
MPRTAREQIFTILSRTIDGDKLPVEHIVQEGVRYYSPTKIWKEIHDEVAFQLGVQELFSDVNSCRDSFYQRFTLEQQEILESLDILEVSLRTLIKLEGIIRSYRGRYQPRYTVDQAITEVNQALKRHDIGYSFVNMHVVRVDSNFLHSEVVEPALRLLQRSGFAGAEAEFLSAHKHFRSGNVDEYEDALVDALKAFESTMKEICTRKEWSFDPTRDTASRLIDTVLSNGLVPDYLNSQFGALKSLLESGIPTVRNRSAGHGS